MIHSQESHVPLAHRVQARERIQTAALACFTAKGLADATMAEIAQRAGMSPGSLYLHFKSKQDLFDSLDRPELAQPTARSRARREQILTAALKTFSEQGYAAATMDEIAASVGLSKAALYSHFASKAELFLGVMRDSSLVDAFEQLSVCARAQKWGCATTVRDLEAFLLEFARLFLEAHRDPQHLELMRLVLSEGMRDTAVAAVVIEKMASRSSQELARRLSGFGLGTVEELTPAAESLMGALFSWVLMHRALAHSSEVSGPGVETVAAEQIVRLFLHGLYGYTSKPRVLRRATKRKS